LKEWGGAVGWGTALQAGRSRVQFPMVSSEFFIDIILSVVLWPWGRLSLKQKWGGGGKGGWCTFMCRLYRNLGASTSWNPKGLSRPVMGLFITVYIYILYIYIYNPVTQCHISENPITQIIWIQTLRFC
jgi:hypothetical protein